MKNVGEKPTDVEAEIMIKEIDVDDAQQRPPGMSQSDSRGAGFGTNRGENRQIITQRARAESHGEADRRSCSQHPNGG